MTCLRLSVTAEWQSAVQMCQCVSQTSMAIGVVSALSLCVKLPRMVLALCVDGGLVCLGWKATQEWHCGAVRCVRVKKLGSWNPLKPHGQPSSRGRCQTPTGHTRGPFPDRSARRAEVHPLSPACPGVSCVVVRVAGWGRRAGFAHVAVASDVCVSARVVAEASDVCVSACVVAEASDVRVSTRSVSRRRGGGFGPQALHLPAAACYPLTWMIRSLQPPCSLGAQ